MQQDMEGEEDTRGVKEGFADQAAQER